MKPKYSFIIPVYNDEKYIKKAIDSIIHQTFSDFECIIVDDNSEDESGRICDNYANIDKRINVFHNEINKGSLYSRDFAIKQSIGDYLLFVDGDDYLEVNALEVIDKTLMNINADLLMFGFRKFDERKILYEHCEGCVLQYNNKNRRDFLMKYLLNAKYNVLWNKVVKSSIIRNIKIPESDYTIARGTDQYLTIDIFKYVKTAVVIQDILYNYRVNDTGITMTQKKKYTLDFRNREKLKKMLSEEECLSIEDVAEFDVYSYEKFRSQIARIANLETSKNEKINIYENIKKQEYYKEYIEQLFAKIHTDYQIDLFVNGKYNALIVICKTKYFLLRLLGKM